MAIITPKKVGIALDVDGTTMDTNFECYMRTSEAWQEMYGQEFPLTYKQFASFRPLVKNAEHYFTFSTMMLGNNGRLPDEAVRINDEIMANPNPEIVRFKELFLKFRDDKIANDKPGWLAEQKMYGDVDIMMRELGQTDWRTFVVTSKNEAAVRELFRHYGLPEVPIFDVTIGKERAKQFARASADTGIELARIIPYDDLVGQLQAAQKLGMTPVGAPQGYNNGAEELGSLGIPVAFPADFVRTVESKILTNW
jgi:phosphoglycolate phosphatase-like HAD superfamily hydrolase